MVSCSNIRYSDSAFTFWLEAFFLGGGVQIAYCSYALVEHVV